MYVYANVLNRSYFFDAPFVAANKTERFQMLSIYFKGYGRTNIKRHLY